MTSTARYFEKHARAFDRLYAEPRLATRALRGGPSRGRDLAAAVVAARPGASVLDVGCGPGRVGAAVLAAGASSYLGVDLSPAMLALARARLTGLGDVELVEADFLDLDLGRTFDVVLALGLFDYLDDAPRAAAWLRRRSASTLVASFTCWDPLKGPPRHLHYRLHGCRVHDFTERGAGSLLAAAGFGGVTVVSLGRSGFLVTAEAA